MKSMKHEQLPFDKLLPEFPTTAEKSAKLRDRGRGILRASKATNKREESTNDNYGKNTSIPWAKCYPPT